MTELPDVNPWPAIIGPCYTDDSLRRELRVNELEIIRATQQLRVLQIVTSDGVNVYPAFQVRDHRIVPGLDAVLRELAQGSYSEPMWAQWLNRPAKRTVGERRRRIDELAAGEITALVSEARHTAAAWLGDGAQEVQMVKAKATLTFIVTTHDGGEVRDGVE